MVRTSIVVVQIAIFTFIVSLLLEAAPLDRIEFEGSIATTLSSEDRVVRAITHVPAGKGPHPVVLALPSESGSQSDAIAVFRRFVEFANLGYAVVAPDISDGALGGIELDDALAWLDYIDRHERLDRKRVVIVGCSHGAYLAALTACRDDVYALILVNGFYELAEYLNNDLRDSRNPTHRALYEATVYEIGTPSDDSGLFISRSPAANVDAISARVLMFHSRRDNRIESRYSQNFADALESAGVRVDYFILDSALHDINITSDEIAGRVIKFLNEIGLPSGEKLSEQPF